MTSNLEETLAQQMMLAGLPTPEREYRFAYPRRFRFDFAFVRQKVAVEVEGAVWTLGRHTRGSGFVADIEKYNMASIDGWKLIRVTGDMIESGEALQTIMLALRW